MIPFGDLLCQRDNHQKFLLHLLSVWSMMSDCRNEGEASVKATLGL